ncbi:fibroblast growth factor receptor 4 isoform X2 [Exaiptasia diaphana]|uniref:receptor protein-tyrosine kinase n=1 Tax=Exaiptasia diaphana TaxID=2652724 RepID=A0A913WU91_EXADI|nr:fibroblast growth factor receptor 4 isoform X2 [Exaiptasia diaphana]
MAVKTLAALVLYVMMTKGILDAKQIQNVTVDEGQNASLPCKLPPSQKMLFLISWSKNTTRYLSKRLNPLSTYKHTKRAVNFGSQNSLNIPLTTSKDADIYKCKGLYVDSSMAETSVRLYVRAKPMISTKKIKITLTQRKLSPLNLVVSCKATGYPIPAYIWTKDGKKISNDRVVRRDSTLVIKDARQSDGGRYSCMAWNNIGKDSKSFTVTVLEPPLIMGKSNFHFNAGQTAKLACESRGNPEPVFTWIWTTADNVTMTMGDAEEDDRYKVRTYRLNHTGVSYLTIKKITDKDWIKYLCRTKNKFGQDAKNISLTGYTNPQSPRILSVKTSPTTAEVTWEFSYDGGVKLLSLTLQYKISSKQKWNSIQITPAEATTYTITDLQSDTNYNYRILASNSIGSSPYSSIYMAKTMQKEASVDALSDDKEKGILGGIDMTVLIAAVAGGFMLLLVIILATLCSIRRMQRRNEQPTSAFGRQESQRDNSEMTSFLPPQSQLPETPNAEATANPLSNSRWEFPRDRIKSSVVLGSGAFGMVMKADAQGIKGCVGSLTVAVKIVKETDSETARKDLLAELELLKLIDPHPNVVGLLGCCTRGDPLMLIVEFCEYGDLQSYLRHCRGIEEKYYQQIYNVPEEKLTSKDLLSFAIQVARGMAHLSSMKVVHRDLAARNILIDDRKVCKVSDFGFARDIYVEDHYTRKTQGGRFPIKWMAIESLLDGVSTTSSDAWSYGVLLWEIVTLGASPYPGMNSQEVINFLRDGYRMDKPKHCSEELYCVMLDCWQVIPQRRPTFLEISRHLHKMLADERDYICMRIYEEHTYMNFDSRPSSTFPGSAGSVASDQPLSTFF